VFFRQLAPFCPFWVQEDERPRFKRLFCLSPLDVEIYETLKPWTPERVKPWISKPSAMSTVNGLESFFIACNQIFEKKLPHPAPPKMVKFESATACLGPHKSWIKPAAFRGQIYVRCGWDHPKMTNWDAFFISFTIWL